MRETAAKRVERAMPHLQAAYDALKLASALDGLNAGLYYDLTATARALDSVERLARSLRDGISS